MKNVLLILFITSSAFGQTNKVQNLITEVPASFRALSAVDNNVIWASGSKGHVVKSLDGGKTWDIKQLKGFENLDFRSCYAFDAMKVVIANAGAPAHILKTTDGGQTWNVVYKNEDKDAFFDGIDFWNEKEGIIFGDPIQSKLLMLKTTDGGETWQMITTSPAVKEGEASFAASCSTIGCLGKKTIVVATGGKSSRLWISNNQGISWDVQETQMVQGTQGSGIFSIAFNKKNAVMVGGDFENDKSQPNQSFYSSNNGKSWKPSETFVRGWRECVEFIDKNTCITTGPNGMEISQDAGKTWISFSNEQSFHIIRKARKGKLIIAAGNKKIALITP